ncbi:hypothetical protein ACFVHS_19715 [Streptomyces sp. NPDC057746]|uniref:hypothetical protein n=1 Tax=Streptomyces sp. NPDC057746 TaxID=3346237 RepID=UPI0036B2F756
MNEQRGGDSVVRQFAGEFETHLTVRAVNCGEGDDAIRRWAEHHGIKYTRIVLDRGRTPDQPMLTCPGRGHLAGQLATARQWSQRLHDDGFRVVRLKIEAAPWNADVPETDGEAADLPGHCYFEHHAKLVLAGESQVAAVRALAAPHSAHVSRNARRTSAGTSASSPSAAGASAGPRRPGASTCSFACWRRPGMRRRRWRRSSSCTTTTPPWTPAGSRAGRGSYDGTGTTHRTCASAGR